MHWIGTSSLAQSRYYCAVIGLFSALALIPISAFAQMGASDVDPSDPGNGGRNSIQGNIFYPSGRRVDRRVRVTLSAVSRSEVTGMTDDNGSFTFRRLSGGSYTIVIDAGKDFEVVTEPVEINQSPSRRGSAGQTVTVQIQLRYRSATASPRGVIDATLADVPKQAVEFYEKGE